MSLHPFDLLFFFFFFLVLLTGALPRPKCQTQCGQINISYPFGIEPGCYYDESFKLTCDHSHDPPRVFLNDQNRSQVIEIQTQTSQVRVKYPYLAGSCFSTENSEGDERHPIATYDMNINLSSTPYTLSEQNVITLVGCDDFVRIYGVDTMVFSGCTAICIDKKRNGACPKDIASSAIGCCRFIIPRGTKQLSLKFTDMHGHSRDDTGRLYSCGYAYIGEKLDNSFSYKLRGLNNSATFLMDNPEVISAPLVLDWWVKNQTCTSTVKNCTCQPFREEGYKCHCNKGYYGNPYLEGCRDIDECSEDGKHECISSSHCKNTAGGYSCFCPKGYGDGKKYGKGCALRPSQLKNALIGVGAGLGSILLLSLCYCLYTVFLRRIDKARKEKFFKHNGGLLLQQQENRGVLGTINLFTSNELEKATDHFNEARLLGQGGHGTVYKGILSNGNIVAIKKAKLLDDNEKEQFINEMVVLSQINHKHVVKLLGCCLETEVPLLVYEFVPSGTLFDLIHDPSVEFPIPWNMRLKIAADVAGAISYLHSASSVPIYHRDIKSNNILMDEKHVAKISDFGTSRLVSVDQTHLTTIIAGTFGYMDPEYFQTSQLTDKSDVYSFGVVLAELLTGRRPISFNRAGEERSLATHFLTSMEDQNIETILDDEVFRGSKDDVMEVAKLAERCLNLKGKLRPTMKVVAMELENIRKSKMSTSPVKEEDEDFEDVIRENGRKLMKLSSFDYSWTWTSSGLSSSSSVKHPSIKGRL